MGSVLLVGGGTFDWHPYNAKIDEDDAGCVSADCWLQLPRVASNDCWLQLPRVGLGLGVGLMLGISSTLKFSQILLTATFNFFPVVDWLPFDLQ